MAVRHARVSTELEPPEDPAQIAGTDWNDPHTLSVDPLEINDTLYTLSELDHNRILYFLSDDPVEVVHPNIGPIAVVIVKAGDGDIHIIPDGVTHLGLGLITEPDGSIAITPAPAAATFRLLASDARGPIYLTHDGASLLPVEGDTVTANYGAGWSGPGQWHRNGSPIGGATNPAAYVLTSSDTTGALITWRTSGGGLDYQTQPLTVG